MCILSVLCIHSVVELIVLCCKSIICYVLRQQIKLSCKLRCLLFCYFLENVEQVVDDQEKLLTVMGEIPSILECWVARLNSD